MMRMEIYTSIESIVAIQAAWTELYDSNDELSPFQSFDWNKALIDNRACSGKLCFCCLYKEGKMVLIAPFIKQYKATHSELVFVGTGAHADYLNFIYCKELEYDEFCWFINEILCCNHNTVLRLDLIPNGSKISSYIKLLPYRQSNRQTTCVKIPICDSVEQYCATLSKSHITNIKRCMRKLEKNFTEVEYRFTENRQLEDRNVDEIFQLYQKRHVELSRSLNLASINSIRQYLKAPCHCFLSECYVDGKIVAMFLGYVSLAGNICVPITAFDNDYKEYSLGKVLLYNTICFLINQKRRIDFDLTRGEEPYKYNLGGVAHTSNTFIVCKKRTLVFFRLYCFYHFCYYKLKSWREASA